MAEHIIPVRSDLLAADGFCERVAAHLHAAMNRHWRKVLEEKFTGEPIRPRPAKAAEGNR